MDTQMIRMTAEEAVTLTKAIESNTAALVKEHTVQAVEQVVVDSVNQLVKDSKPLSELPTITFEIKRQVDIAADSILAGVHNILKGYIQIYGQTAIDLLSPETQQFNAAQVLLSIIFPDGTGFLKDTWYEQYGATEMLLNRSRSKEAQSAIQTLGLVPAFQLLSRIHKEYGEKMGFSKVNDSDENTALDNWYETLEVFLSIVKVKHKRGSSLRAELHEPYALLVEKIREQRRKARLQAESQKLNETGEIRNAIAE